MKYFGWVLRLTISNNGFNFPIGSFPIPLWWNHRSSSSAILDHFINFQHNICIYFVFPWQLNHMVQKNIYIIHSFPFTSQALASILGIFNSVITSFTKFWLNTFQLKIGGITHQQNTVFFPVTWMVKIGPYLLGRYWGYHNKTMCKWMDCFVWLSNGPQVWESIVVGVYQ